VHRDREAPVRGRERHGVAQLRAVGEGDVAPLVDRRLRRAGEPEHEGGQAGQQRATGSPPRTGSHRELQRRAGSVLAVRTWRTPLPSPPRSEMIEVRGHIGTRRPIMAGVESRAFDSPDETRTTEKTQVAVVRLSGATAARMTFEPGWKWSDCVKPAAGTDSCQRRHVGVAQAGQLHVEHDDGSKSDISPGDAYVIEPGHDAWVVGDDTFVGYEFESGSAEKY